MPTNTGPIEINEHDTYYPKAGMLRAGGTSFMDVRTLARQGWGLHFCRDVLLSGDAEATQIALSRECMHLGMRMGYVCVHYRKRSHEHPLPIRCTLSSQNMHLSMVPLLMVRTIQRWLRRKMEAWRQTKRLAFAMGLHARLGRQSQALSLHADTLRLILEAS
jgi:hypothetical protein